MHGYSAGESTHYADEIYSNQVLGVDTTQPGVDIATADPSELPLPYRLEPDKLNSILNTALALAKDTTADEVDWLAEYRADLIHRPEDLEESHYQDGNILIERWQRLAGIDVL